MVHAESRLPVMEIATHHGVCASGMHALKNAYLHVQSGEQSTAVPAPANFRAVLFKHTRFEAQAAMRIVPLPFDTDFLRSCSPTAQARPCCRIGLRQRGLSLRIEWIDNQSYREQIRCLHVCGTELRRTTTEPHGWIIRSIHEAADDGAVNLKQDIRLVNEMPKVGVNRFFELVEEGRIDPAAIDWMVCHYSSHFFRDEIFRLLQLGGLTIPEEKWFTNLYTKGNTGAASIYIMLEELLNRIGSRRASRCCAWFRRAEDSRRRYMLLTVVGHSHEQEEDRSAIRRTSAGSARSGI